MDYEKIVKFLMPGKVKLFLFIILFLVLPGIIISADIIDIMWLFSGIILIPIAEYINPLSFILLIIEAYLVACLIVNHFAPKIEKSQKSANMYYPQVRRKSN